jgi:hypothetical protein
VDSTSTGKPSIAASWSIAAPPPGWSEAMARVSCSKAA